MNKGISVGKSLYNYKMAAWTATETQSELLQQPE